MKTLVKSMPMSRIYDGNEPKKALELYKDYGRVYWLFVKETLWKNDQEIILESFENAASSWNSAFKNMKKFKPKTGYRVCIVPDNWKRGVDFWLYDAAYAVEDSQMAIVAQPNWTSDHPFYKRLIYPLSLSESEKELILEDQITSFLFYCLSSSRNS